MRPPIPDKCVHLVHQAVLARLGPLFPLLLTLPFPFRQSSRNHPTLTPLLAPGRQPLVAVVVDTPDILRGAEPACRDLRVVHGIVCTSTIAHAHSWVEEDARAREAAGQQVGVDEAAFTSFDAFRREGVVDAAVADWWYAGAGVGVEGRRVHGDNAVPAACHGDGETGGQSFTGLEGAEEREVLGCCG